MKKLNFGKALTGHTTFSMKNIKFALQHKCDAHCMMHMCTMYMCTTRMCTYKHREKKSAFFTAHLKSIYLVRCCKYVKAFYFCVVMSIGGMKMQHNLFAESSSALGTICSGHEL